MVTGQRVNKNTHMPEYQAGAVAVEFAFVIILLLMIVGAIIEFGRIFWYYDALTKATRDGARLMSMADKATINSGGVSAAKDLVVEVANDAKVSPQLAEANVQVQCLNDGYEVVGCADGVAPANVRVGIVGFNVEIGGWIPVFMSTGEANVLGSVSLAPHTIMRYMP